MFCETGKVQYTNAKEASTAAANLSRHDRRHKYSFYNCPICKLFHTNTVKKKKMLTPKKVDKYPDKFIQSIKNQKLHPIPIPDENKKSKKNKKRGRKNRRNS